MKNGSVNEQGDSLDDVFGKAFDFLVDLKDSAENAFAALESARDMYDFSCLNSKPAESLSVEELVEQIEKRDMILLSTVWDSLAWVWLEVTGRRMTPDEELHYEPDDVVLYDREAMRRTIAQSKEGTEAIDRAYVFALSRPADHAGREFYREELASGRLTYIELVNRLLASDERKLNEKAQKYADSLRTDDGSSSDPAVPAAEPQVISNFLEIEGDQSRSSQQFLAVTFSDAERYAMLEQHRSEGMTHFHLQFALGGDYDGKHRYCYAHQDRDRVTYWVKKIREYGMDVIAWAMCDDEFSFFSRGDKGGSLGEYYSFISALIQDVVLPLGIRYVVPGLESREYWNLAQHQEIFTRWRTACPDTQIIFHTLYNDVTWLEYDWMDAVSFQQNVEENIPECTAKLVRAIEVASPKPVYAGEHTRQGFSVAGRERATAFLAVPGCVGSWTGGRL